RQGLPGGQDFAPAVVLNPGRPASDVTLVSLGPGRTGLAVADRQHQQVFVYVWHAPGFALTSFTAGLQPSRLASADLNGDGQGDLVAAGALTGQVTVALQTAGDHFTPMPARAVGGTPAAL